MLSIPVYNNLNYNPVAFGARYPKVNKAGVGELVSDIVELSHKKTQRLDKVELTETEKAFSEVLTKKLTVEMNLVSQKYDMMDFYYSGSKQDRAELLKEKRRLEGQLKRIAKKDGRSCLDLKISVKGKKAYNKYAPKIFRATNEEELMVLQNEIDNRSFYFDSKQWLLQAIEQQRNLLKKLS